MWATYLRPNHPSFMNTATMVSSEGRDAWFDCDTRVELILYRYVNSLVYTENIYIH